MNVGYGNYFVTRITRLLDSVAKTSIVDKIIDLHPILFGQVANTHTKGVSYHYVVLLLTLAHPDPTDLRD